MERKIKYTEKKKIYTEASVPSDYSEIIRSETERSDREIRVPIAPIAVFYDLIYFFPICDHKLEMERSYLNQRAQTEKTEKETRESNQRV